MNKVRIILAVITVIGACLVAYIKSPKSPSPTISIINQQNNNTSPQPNYLPQEVQLPEMTHPKKSNLTTPKSKAKKPESRHTKSNHIETKGACSPIAGSIQGSTFSC